MNPHRSPASSWVALALAVGVLGTLIPRQPSGPAAALSSDRAYQRVARWTNEARDLAELMLDRHGAPDFQSSEGLVWTNRKPWKRIVVSREPAEALLEQAVAYILSPEQAAAIRRSGLGIYAEPRAKELSARSNSEAANLLALNLADDIARGRRTPEQARLFHERTLLLSESGKSSPYLAGLRFNPAQPPSRRWPELRLILY